MAQSNPIDSFESLIGTLISTHVSAMMHELEVGPASPIADFEPKGSTVFVLYANNDAPLAVGSLTSRATAASRSQTRRMVNQFVATGMVASFRSIAIPSDELVGVFGRMIGGLLGSGVLRIGEEVRDKSVASEPAARSAAKRGRRPGRAIGAGKGSRKGKAGRPKKVAEAGTEDAASDIAPNRHRGRKPGSKNRPRAADGTKAARRNRVAAGAQPDEPVRRRPGRPKKSEPADATAAAPAKRRPGRPKKSTQDDVGATKRRGRPSASTKKGAGKGRRKRATPAESNVEHILVT